MSVERVYEVRCDYTYPNSEGCEETSEVSGESKSAARFFAEEYGWLTAQADGSDFCPAHRKLVDG